MTRVLPSLFLLLSLLVATSVRAELRPLDSIVAVVNDDVILDSELTEATRLARLSLQQRGIPEPPKQVLQQQVLESLITKHLQRALAEQMNLSVDDRRLRQVMQSIAQNRGLGDVRALKRSIEAQGEDYNDFREQIREEVMISDLLQRTVRPQVNVSEQEVDNFLASQQAQGELNIEYRLSHILIQTPQAASSDQIATARDKAQKLLSSLRGGADFAKAAVENSSGRNALQGGDLGWVKAAQLPTLFIDAVPKLERGEISDLLRSSSGFHIIKLVDVRNSDRQAFSTDMSQMRQQAMQAIQERKFNEQLEEWLRELRNQAYVEIRL
ncbi:MAG: peptidylprolyl isomerase [Gammaproteobacteria bacterium]|nr:peptidylprolyl isomerase [Gammaproteobacteria bacterium]